tara:strand:+ start:6293 stop:6841 length:549 start_codon:yes stop_codon:yes gene_type:complete
MLADDQIKWLSKSKNGKLIHPFHQEQLQPASYDLTLGTTKAVMHKEIPPRFLVGTDTPNYVYTTYEEDGLWMLPPGQLALFQTAETLWLPPDVAGKFEGKSSLGRIGLMTHITAGFIDPGFHGVLTLEVYNCGRLPLELVPGIRIGQVAFHRLESAPTRTYGDAQLGSHYQGATQVEGGRFG